MKRRRGVTVARGRFVAGVVLAIALPAACGGRSVRNEGDENAGHRAHSETGGGTSVDVGGSTGPGGVGVSGGPSSSGMGMGLSGRMGAGGRAAVGGRPSRGVGGASAGNAGSLAGSGGTLAGNGGAIAGNLGTGGDGGEDDGPVPSNPTRGIELTALEIELDAHTSVAKITFAPSKARGATLEVGDLALGRVSIGADDVRFSVAAQSMDIGAPRIMDVDVPASETALTVRVEYGWQYHDDFDGIDSSGYTFTWPRYCGNVFPCHSSTADGTQFSLVVSGASKTLVYPREILSDAPSYMLAWIEGDYTRLDLGTTTAGTHVSAWYLPGGEEAAIAGTHDLAAAFDWYEQHLGPYRFGRDVGSVSAPWPSGYGGMEHHPYWHVKASEFDFRNHHIHEAGHGWFGNGVRIRCVEDVVLSEGTTTYLSARATEAVAGTAEGDAVWTYLEEKFAAIRDAENVVVWLPGTCDEVPSYSRMTYLKGAFFLRALEQRVGRDALDEVLREFYARHAGEAAGVQDLLDLVLELTAFDPTHCAGIWLASYPIPDFGPCE